MLWWYSIPLSSALGQEMSAVFLRCVWGRGGSLGALVQALFRVNPGYAWVRGDWMLLSCLATLVSVSLRKKLCLPLSLDWRGCSSNPSSTFVVFLNCSAGFWSMIPQVLWDSQSRPVGSHGSHSTWLQTLGKAESTWVNTPKSTSFLCCEEEISTRGSSGSHLFCLSCYDKTLFSFPEIKAGCHFVPLFHVFSWFISFHLGFFALRWVVGCVSGIRFW